MEEFSPHSQHSQAGEVSFESKNMEQDYDQICLKVHLHPLHLAAKNILGDYFLRYGGSSEQSVNKIL